MHLNGINKIDIDEIENGEREKCMTNLCVCVVKRTVCVEKFARQSLDFECVKMNY